MNLCSAIYRILVCCVADLLECGRLKTTVDQHAVRVSKRCNRASAQLGKIFQRLRKIWVFEQKMQNLPMLYFFGSFFIFYFFCFLACFVCAQLLNRNIGCAKKITFRKSAFSTTQAGCLVHKQVYQAELSMLSAVRKLSQGSVSSVWLSASLLSFPKLCLSSGYLQSRHHNSCP